MKLNIQGAEVAKERRALHVGRQKIWENDGATWFTQWVKWNYREKMPCNIPKHKLFSAFPLRPLRLCGENLRLN
jgi:hypothetical protein